MVVLPLQRAKSSPSLTYLVLMQVIHITICWKPSPGSLLHHVPCREKLIRGPGVGHIHSFWAHPFYPHPLGEKGAIFVPSGGEQRHWGLVWRTDRCFIFTFFFSPQFVLIKYLKLLWKWSSPIWWLTDFRGCCIFFLAFFFNCTFSPLLLLPYLIIDTGGHALSWESTWQHRTVTGLFLGICLLHTLASLCYTEPCEMSRVVPLAVGERRGCWWTPPSSGKLKGIQERPWKDGVSTTWWSS